jgi:hypothetical protein
MKGNDEVIWLTDERWGFRVHFKDGTLQKVLCQRGWRQSKGIVCCQHAKLTSFLREFLAKTHAVLAGAEVPGPILTAALHWCPRKFVGHAL